MDYWPRVLACRGNRDSRVRSYRVQWIHGAHVAFFMLSIAAGLTVSAAIIMICGLIASFIVIIFEERQIKVDQSWFRSCGEAHLEIHTTR